MKKMLKKPYLLFAVAYFTILTANAQTSTIQDASTEEVEIVQHELRLNALYLLLGSFEVNYEYLLNEDSGIGITAMYTYDDDFWEYKQQISGYYRHYFGKKYAGGFYGEAFIMYNAIDEEYFYYSENGSGYEEKLSHNLGLGFAFGTKLISKKNLLLDIGLGLGRNIISSEDDEWLVPRFNISFGYRF